MDGFVDTRRWRGSFKVKVCPREMDELLPLVALRRAPAGCVGSTTSCRYHVFPVPFCMALSQELRFWVGFFAQRLERLMMLVVFDNFLVC